MTARLLIVSVMAMAGAAIVGAQMQVQPAYNFGSPNRPYSGGPNGGFGSGWGGHMGPNSGMPNWQQITRQVMSMVTQFLNDMQRNLNQQYPSQPNSNMYPSQPGSYQGQGLQLNPSMGST